MSTKTEISEIPDNWRTWISQNFLTGYPVDWIKQVLTQNGFSETAIEQEMLALLTHPYMQGARVIANQLKRREWLLKTLDYMRVLKHPEKEILQIEAPPYQQFLQDHYYSNRPCVLKKAAAQWPCMKWTWESLREMVGAGTEVNFQKDRESNKKLYDVDRDQHKASIKFGAFVDLLKMLEQDQKSSNNIYITAHNSAANVAAFEKLFADVGNIGDGYLDDSLAATRDHCRIWMGPKGVVTATHFDTTNVMVVQVLGRKRFLLTPAMDAAYMYNQNYCFSEVDVLAPDLGAYPDYAKAAIFDVTIDPGDAIYIPTGWWHCVQGVETSLSLSLMNFNAPNNSELPLFADII